jgi:thioredoxin reductase (NADPH)
MKDDNIKNSYELAIIGNGPAGMAAAVNAKIRNKDFIIFGPAHGSLSLTKAPQVDNYLGITGLSGKELNQYFLKHLELMQIKTVNKRITNIYPGKPFTILATDITVEADTIILATGVSVQKLFPGETELLGKGVGYCATCDGPLYKDKRVVIISYSPEGEHEANYMMEMCSEVYYIPYYKNVGKLADRIQIKRDVVKRIKGKDKVEELELLKETLPIDGVFILRESMPVEQLVPGLEMDKGAIKVGRDFATNIPGLFAAGDCTGQPYQLLKAVGEGATASLMAIRYLENK